MREDRTGTGLPAYRDLPRGVSGAGSGWGLFGDGDDLGLMNLQTPQRIVEALRLARRGEVFSLSAPLDLFDPPFFGQRTPPRHTILPGSARAFDDVLDNFYPQASSQIDSLGHIGAADGVFYGGATAAEIRSGRRNSIDAWATKGIVGRGIVLDMAQQLGMGPGGEPRVGTRVPITVADLESARARTGLTFQPGDVMLLHTGFVDWWSALGRDDRRAYVADVRNAGLEQSEEMAEYLWDLHISMVVVDNIAIEAWPPDQSEAAYPFGFLHTVLIGELGLALGELWNLGPLAADCRADGVHECAVISAPIRTRAGVGSPANALAIK
ncbi:cyclase family protein [Conexibacter sp. CPCC 206217]|uniref:cyclase family protein n=1 Tax=Conexibacter sp. CPCC 206217 TaxID=3064574 RepID=UPI00271C43E7|nr:cyclase family protein [Conexibacter sp. CPCC 206217]MDO8213171.1 cyclase family protein [Conexibacter sp. CPCC 206217]